MSAAAPFHDALVEGLPRGLQPDEGKAWFDRFYFNLHPDDAGPLIVLGAGVYPGAGVVDGYVCALWKGEQRNLRLSAEPGKDGPAALGPYSWTVLEPLRSWRLRLEENPSGIELDLVWAARAPAWAVEPIRVESADDTVGRTDFAHFFQSGRYEGTLSVDGCSVDVGGWLGQRDRSRGLRRTRDRLGMHVWVAAQLPDLCVGLNFNEDRLGRTTHCDGALLGNDGTTRPIVGAQHRFELDATDELLRGALRLELADGAAVDLELTATQRGLYMAGAGYGGWHGVPRGLWTVEHERWPLDGARNPRTLPLGLVDKLCRYSSSLGGGHGLLELALSRSASYSYKATLQ